MIVVRPSKTPRQRNVASSFNIIIDRTIKPIGCIGILIKPDMLQIWIAIHRSNQINHVNGPHNEKVVLMNKHIRRLDCVNSLTQRV